MGKPDSTSGSRSSTVYNTVFIDTSLDTHLAMIVSDSDTVSDLKKKILYEHPLCFPNIGKIKINALKVKRKGYLYHLSDSMFVKSAFDGVSKSWFLSVDALGPEKHNDNHNSCKPDTGNDVTCFGITTNNSSAGVVDLLPDGPSKRLLNVNDSSLPQDENNHHAKQKLASQQFGFTNSAEANSGDLPMEGEQTNDSTAKILVPASNNGSKPKVQEKDVGNKKNSEDLPASVAAPLLREKHKAKKRKKDATRDHAVKESNASVVESGKDALDSDNVNRRSVSPDINKRSATRKRMADEGAEVPGKHSECKTNKHKGVSLNEQECKLTENSSQPGSASKKKHKPEKNYGNENSLIQNGVLTGFDKQGTLSEITSSECSLGQKLGSTSAKSDHINAEPVKDSQRRRKKRQKSNPSEVGSEISKAKDVHVDMFQAAEAINHKDLGNKADLGFVLGTISEPRLTSSEEIQEVSKNNKVPTSEGDDDMVDTNYGNTESKNEACEPDVGSVMKMRDSNDHNANHVDGHPIIMSERGTNLLNDLGVSGHQSQSGRLEANFVKPKKSSKKIKQPKKSKDPDGVTEVLDAGDRIDPAIDISPAEHPTSLTGDRLSDDTDVRADDVIRDVLESLHCNNGPVDAENLDKKSRKKIKKKSSTVDAQELQGKEDVDHRDPTAPAEDMSEVSTQSKSTRKKKVVNSSSAGQSNGSNLVHKDNAEVGISPVHNQLELSQNTPKANHEGGPIQDVFYGDHPRSTHLVDANNSVEVLCESERIKSQQQHGIVDSGETLLDKATDKKGVETEVKGKKKKKPDVQSGESTPDLLSSQMLNGKHKKAEGRAAKSSSIQSQRSSSKVEPYSSKVQSSKTLDHEGRPIQDVVNEDEAKGSDVIDANKSIEVCRESEMIRSHNQHEIIDSGEILIDMVTDRKGVEKEVKGKKKKKKPDAQSGGSIPDLPSSKMLNGNLLEKAEAQAAKSSSIQSQRSSSKVEPRSSNTQSSKTPLTISGSVGRKPLQSNKTDTINSIPKEAQRPIDINLSKAHTIDLNEGGNERQSHLDIAKATGSNNGKVMKNLENKKSLLATAGTIFKHDDKESSDDEDGVDHSNDRTRTPSDSSSSDDDSDVNISSSRNGSYNSEGKGGGRNRKRLGSSSPKSLSLHAILRNSSSYKKAKLTASQSQLNDLDSQPDEFVPDSQAN